MSTWNRLRTRYMALARRERALVLAAALAVVLGGGSVVFIEPAQRQRASLQEQFARQSAELAALRPQVQQLQERQRNPDAATQAQLQALQHRLQAADDEFAQLQRALVPPQDMGRLLDSLLRSHRGLQLVALHSLAPTSVGDLLAPPAAASAASAPAGTPHDWLYRHGVQVTLQGSYADLVAWLDDLERQPRRVYWGELKLDATRWPATVMTVTVYTISLEKTWWRV